MTYRKKKIIFFLWTVSVIFLLVNGISAQFLTTQEMSAAANSDDTYENIHRIKSSVSIIKWLYPEWISNESIENSKEPFLATDASDNIHIVWTDWSSLEPDFDSDIFYKKYDTSNNQWTDVELISNGSTFLAGSSNIGVDSQGNIHIVWGDSTDNYINSGSDRDIFYKYLNISTGTWSKTEIVSEGSIDSMYPEMNVDISGNIHVMWKESTLGNYRYYYKLRNATTNIWTTNELVWTGRVGETYSLAVDTDGNVHFVHDDDPQNSAYSSEIHHHIRNFTTATWMPYEIISEGPSDSIEPDIAIDNLNNTHVVWTDTNEIPGAEDAFREDIFYRCWNSTTKTWMAIEVASVESLWWCSKPSIDTDNSGDVHMVWEDYSDFGTPDDTDRTIVYKMKENISQTWTYPEIVSIDSAEPSQYPVVRVDQQGNPHIVWVEWDNYYMGSGQYNDIFYNNRTHIESFTNEPITPPPDGTGDSTGDDDDDDDDDITISGYEVLFITALISVVIGINVLIIAKKRIKK